MDASGVTPGGKDFYTSMEDEQQYSDNSSLWLNENDVFNKNFEDRVKIE